MPGLANGPNVCCDSPAGVRQRSGVHPLHTTHVLLVSGGVRLGCRRCVAFPQSLRARWRNTGPMRAWMGVPLASDNGGVIAVARKAWWGFLAFVWLGVRRLLPWASAD